MAKKYFLLIIFLTINISSSIAQGEFNQWNFGDHFRIDFNFNSTQLFENTGMVAMEANNTMCDKYGNILFYTNGATAFNAVDDTLPNGTNLGGHLSAKHCAIIPHPGDNNLYYIISANGYEDQSSLGISYSMVDMRLDGGLGDVTGERVPLQDYCCESMAVVRHCNKRDYWLLIHQRPYIALGNVIYVYLINQQGLNTTPITFTTSEAINGFRVAFNNTGNLFFMDAANIANRLIAFEFDNENGSISELAIYNFTGGLGEYLISPDGSKLYITENSDLYQCDISDPSNATNVVGSKTLIESNATFRFLQNNFQGEILCSALFTPQISVIHQPNLAGLSCGLSLYEFVFGNLAPNSSMGLPLPIVNFEYANSFTWDRVCLGDTTSFSYLLSDCEYATFIEWNFGDMNSADTLSYIENPVHYYPQAGKYIVRLVTNYTGQNDTIYKTIEIFDNSLNLGTDTFLNAGDTIVLDPGYEYFSFDWSTGETSQSIDVLAQGTYSLSVVDRYACSLSDTIQVSTLSLAETIDKRMILYPNPASKQITISTDRTIKQIEIYSQTGQLLRKINSHKKQETLEISTLAPGNYFIRAIGREDVWVEKFVVVR